jgi:hypothetical protein
MSYFSVSLSRYLLMKGLISSSRVNLKILSRFPRNTPPIVAKAELCDIPNTWVEMDSEHRKAIPLETIVT